MDSLLFDTETTGIPRHPNAKDSIQPSIIEWGGILVNESGKIIEKLNLLINPPRVATIGDKMSLDWEGIKKISGITKEQVENEPSFAEVAGTLRDLFAKADVLIAHNLPFDKTMMEIELRRAGMADGWPWPKIQICTVQEHVEAWGYRPKLKLLYEKYTGFPLEQKHRAIEDCMALLTICKLGKILK